MTVDPARAAAKVEYGGKTWYFCSKGCAEKFKKEPERFSSNRKTFSRRPFRHRRRDAVGRRARTLITF